MKLARDLTSQVFAAVISIVLVITFYLVLMTGLLRGTESFVSEGVLTPLILIIIAIILLAIFSTIAKLENKLAKKR